MNLDNPNAIEPLATERVIIGNRQTPVYAHVIEGGDPVTGGALNARQDGDQLVLRFKKVDYPEPQVHESLKTDNFGTLTMKQRFTEGEYWACLCTGATRARHDV